jgi:hypothetical protein
MPNWFLTDCDIIEPGIGVSHRRAASVDVQPNVICIKVQSLVCLRKDPGSPETTVARGSPMTTIESGRGSQLGDDLAGRDFNPICVIVQTRARASS